MKNQRDWMARVVFLIQIKWPTNAKGLSPPSRIETFLFVFSSFPRSKGFTGQKDAKS